MSTIYNVPGDKSPTWKWIRRIVALGLLVWLAIWLIGKWRHSPSDKTETAEIVTHTSKELADRYETYFGPGNNTLEKVVDAYKKSVEATKAAQKKVAELQLAFDNTIPRSVAEEKLAAATKDDEEKTKKIEELTDELRKAKQQLTTGEFLAKTDRPRPSTTTPTTEPEVRQVEPPNRVERITPVEPMSDRDFITPKPQNAQPRTKEREAFRSGGQKQGGREQSQPAMRQNGTTGGLISNPRQGQPSMPKNDGSLEMRLFIGLHSPRNSPNHAKIETSTGTVMFDNDAGKMPYLTFLDRLLEKNVYYRHPVEEIHQAILSAHGTVKQKSVYAHPLEKGDQRQGVIEE